MDVEVGRIWLGEAVEDGAIRERSVTQALRGEKREE
jgi:hypothetical protein